MILLLSSILVSSALNPTKSLGWPGTNDIPSGHPFVSTGTPAQTTRRYYVVTQRRKQPVPIKVRARSFENRMASLKKSQIVISRRVEVFHVSGKLRSIVTLGSELIGVQQHLAQKLNLPKINKLLQACRRQKRG